MKNKLLLIFLTLSAFTGYSQLVDPDKVDYTRELTYGLTTNTKSSLLGGFNLFYSRRYNDKEWFMYGIEVVNLQHTREIKVIGGSGSAYIAGKVNYLFSFRPEIGYQRTLFQKDRQDGIRLNLVLAGGPSIGLLKPYFVEVINEKETTYLEDGIVKDTIIQTVDFEGYNPDTHSASNILGSGGFFRGFNEMKAKLGIHARIGLNLEFAAFETKASGIEVGFSFEQYFSDIVVHDTHDRQNFWSAFYLNLYFGSKYPSKNTVKLAERQSQFAQ